MFGTPESLSGHGDAEILVARGMTYDRLISLFPKKHVVEIQLSSFDILEALIKARQEFAPKKLSLIHIWHRRGFLPPWWICTPLSPLTGIW